MVTSWCGAHTSLENPTLEQSNILCPHPLLPQLPSAQQGIVLSLQPNIMFLFKAFKWSLYPHIFPNVSESIHPSCNPKTIHGSQDFRTSGQQMKEVSAEGRWITPPPVYSWESAFYPSAFPRCFEQWADFFLYNLWFLFMTIACNVHFLGCKYFPQSQLECNEYDSCYLLSQDPTTSLGLHVCWLTWPHSDTSEMNSGLCCIWGLISLALTSHLGNGYKWIWVSNSQERFFSIKYSNNCWYDQNYPAKYLYS